ncbi:MAG: hypothetical protein WCP89_00885 [archaeon]
MNRGLIIGIVVLIIIALFGIFVLSGGSDRSDAPTNSPKEVYLAYHAEFENINNLDDYISLLNKYGTKEVKSQLYKFDEYKGVLGESTIALLKSSTPKLSEFTNIDEKISGNDATLVITTANSKTGNVILLKEDNAWKIVKADWNTNVSVTYTKNYTIAK